MSKSSSKPVAVGLGTALAGGLLLSGPGFAIAPLAQGYMAGAQQAAPAAQRATGERSRARPAAMGDADGDGRLSRAEFEARHPGDAAGFAAMDRNGDGYVDQDEYAAHGDATKAGMEGKCGEGKCGGMA